MSKGNSSPKTATEALKILWKKKFFNSSAQKLSNVSNKLSEMGYNSPQSILGKALERAAYLTRRGKKGAFEYIQKYPPENE